MAGTLPTRTLRVETADPDELAAAQPERKRRFDHLGSGPFSAALVEVAWGAAALQAERWACGVRVRSDRPPGYVTFALVDAAGDARWCGVPLTAGTLLRIEQPWELTSAGPLQLVAFAVDAERLRAWEDRLAGGAAPPAPPGNRVARVGTAGLADCLRGLLDTVRSGSLGAPALAAAESELFHLAGSLPRACDSEPVERVASPARRRAVRRVEAFLDAARDAAPSIATLCAAAGVSERTLEYAFREHVGMTPVQFLKRRRLNGVHRRLIDRDVPADSVAAAAHQAGIYDLGRFAGEYRRLFGELPSETLRRTQAGVRRVAARPGTSLGRS